jgi:L-cysteine desulfidase
MVHTHPVVSRFLTRCKDACACERTNLGNCADLNFRGGIRFGKLLEDIDAFAGNIAFMHCNDGDPNTKVHTQPENLKVEAC